MRLFFILWWGDEWMGCLLMILFLGILLASKPCFAKTPALEVHKSPEFWIERCIAEKNALLSGQEIQTINHEMQKSAVGLYDMVHISTDWQEEFKQRHGKKAAIWQEIFYHDGKIVTKEWKETIFDECNGSPVLKGPFRYAVTVRGCNVRRLPVGESWVCSLQDAAFDALQETLLNPSEAVRVLHCSRTGKYCYVQAFTYRGWVLTADLGFTNWAKWSKYARLSVFVTILSAQFHITNGKETLLYQMGARIPVQAKLTSGVLLLVPAANENGKLEEQVEYKAYGPSFCNGVLAYTRENVLRQAFKYLGEPYGWGGACHAVDCSSFIMAVYQTVGFHLPRNASQQAMALPRLQFFHNVGNDKKHQILNSLRAGDLLFMPGHVMLYLGDSCGKYYVLHALSGYKEKDAQGAMQVVRMMSVVVTDLSLERKSGGTFFGAISQSGSFV